MGRDKGTSKPARAKPGWGIQVRLSGGGRSWYFLDDRYSDSSGQPAERWSPHESQAVRFDDERAAQRVAKRMMVNTRALEYLVVPLTPLQTPRRARSKPEKHDARGVGQGA